ncbi:MAG: hypothetical protein KAG66_09225, partial [Methylococcales bacterium]|nr:hypothetical protein [Methylococcales bacterium]
VWNTAWKSGDWTANQTVWTATKGGYSGTAEPAQGGNWGAFFSQMREGYCNAYKDLWEIFDREVGRDRVVHVLPGQRVGNDLSEKVALAKTKGMSVDAISIAPYFGSALNPQSGNIWAEVNADIDGHVTSVMNTMKALADTNGYELICYEGGQELTGKGVADTRPANSDPRMYTAYKRWLNVVVPKCDRLISYKYSTRESVDFAFGETRDIAASLSSEHKLRALVDYAKDNGWENGG